MRACARRPAIDLGRRVRRIALDGRVPHPTTLTELTTWCGEAAVAGLNEALLARRPEQNLLRTAWVRADTTVLDASVAYPADAGLLARHPGSRQVRGEDLYGTIGMAARTPPSVAANASSVAGIGPETDAGRTHSGRRSAWPPARTADALVIGVQLGWERRAVKPPAQPTSFEPKTCHHLQKRPASWKFRLSGPFLLCSVGCHLVALRAAVSRCRRTYRRHASGRAELRRVLSARETSSAQTRERSSA